MSKYTNDQLRNGTLVGAVATEGNPWWGNGHFDGYVPIEEARKLLTVEVIERDVVAVDLAEQDALLDRIKTAHASEIPDLIEMVKVSRGMLDTGRFKAIADRTDGYVFQIAGKGWTHHEYVEVLLENVGLLLDAAAGELQVGSVVALDHRQKAVVQVRPNEGITVGGDRILPWLAAFSSLDSSWATGYKPVATRIVCDNTAEAAYRERTNAHRIRHTKNSRFSLAKAREAVGLFFEGTVELEREIEELMNTTVEDRLFNRVLDTLWNVTEDGITDRAVSRRTNIRREVSALWHDDPRVAPFHGTAWGALQAVNTWGHHFKTVKGGDRVGRQAGNLISGETEELDQATIAAINDALSAVGREMVLAN